MLVSQYGLGDYIKADFKDERTGESEWMWVRIKGSDNDLRGVFGTRDRERITMTDLNIGMVLEVSYDNIRDHRTEASFRQ
jgi:hypothetical protein